ncbi:hypothetical protein ACFS07_06240 [Undibacterium arcticum]
MPLDSLALSDLDDAWQAIGSKLFRPEGEERVSPSHRSVAEYLAARWLAQRIDEGLLLGRVLNLLLGRDGRAVAGLRGLYGWLALRCHAARPRLIEADPLTVIVYGDVKPMPVPDKRHILAGLRREAERFTEFRWDAPTKHRFGALADAELCKDFLTILNSPVRGDADQALVDCVLDIVEQGDVQPELVPVMLAVIRDETRWTSVRKKMHFTSGSKWGPTRRLHLRCLAISPMAACPMTTTNLLASYFVTCSRPILTRRRCCVTCTRPRPPNLLGSYVWFWTHEILQCAPEHLPLLLDGLVDRPEFCFDDHYERRLNTMADTLLARGVTIHGDQITDDRLFAWLGIGIDQHGHMIREKTQQQTIAGWLEVRPARYKAILKLCFAQCERHENPAVLPLRCGSTAAPCGCPR